MLVSTRVQGTRTLINRVKTSLRRNRSLHHRHMSAQGARDVSLEIHGETFKFPHVWLRDNCQCEKCFHQSAKSRIIDWREFDLNTRPKSIVNEGNCAVVTWDDGHTSRFELNWLKARSFTRKYQQQYDEQIYQPAKTTWDGSEFERVCTKHDYQAILKSDDALHDWLHNLCVYGVALIRNSPTEEAALDAVVARIGFPKRTHYGAKFVVQSVANTSNVAYQSSALQMHTDLPYYAHCPGANLLLCVRQAPGAGGGGGSNLLADGHRVAAHMRAHHRALYARLTDTDVEWSDVGIEDGNHFYKLHRAPVIVLDKHHQVVGINFSIPQRGAHFPGPVEDVAPWYEAHGVFLSLAHKFSAKFKTAPGDILVFDNRRLLHGREAYEDTPDNVRKLLGAYVDWDEIYSRWRYLTTKLNKNK